MVGLLHDIDFELYPEQHCVKCVELLQKGGVPEDMIHAIVSHGYGICADVAPEREMEKVLFACDELTGLIWAAALMRPSKSQKVQKFKVDETTPCFRNIDINHVICRTARRAAYFNGLPEMPVSNIHIKDMEVNNAEYGIVINRTDGVKLENIKVSAKNHTFDAKNSKNVTVNDKTYKKIDEKGLTLDF